MHKIYNGFCSTTNWMYDSWKTRFSGYTKRMQQNIIYYKLYSHFLLIYTLPSKNIIYIECILSLVTTCLKKKLNKINLYNRYLCYAINKKKHAL